MARPRGPRSVRWLVIASILLVATAFAEDSGGGPRSRAAATERDAASAAPQERRPPTLLDPYLAELTARADELGLANDPQWWALLHFEHRLTGRVESTVDSDDFLLAPDGRTDPRAELHATLARFFEPAATLKDDEPPQCALRGRYLWLDRRLHFDPTRLPPQPCAAYDEWRAAIDPAGVTLVFPEAYMNNPSSMFGHTLLRIDSATGKDLLAYGSNYSADTGQDGALSFTFKGILGYYDGRFSIHPYYDIIKQYGDWEQRDIWEYALTLDAEQTELLLAHLWELRGVTFDYYFFDENCSYQILVLLDAARPGLDLERQFRGWVIPADTVRAVATTPGLIAGATFRPSAATRLRHAAAEMPHAQNELAAAIADGRRPTDDPELARLPDDAARAAVLNTAFDLFRYRYLIDREATPDEQHRARAILLARSQVPFEGSGLEPVPTPAVRPDQGHGSNRAVLGSGVRDGRFYVEAGFRPAYHDLLDPGGGYTPGAAIDFLDLLFRYYTKDRDPRVERFTLLDITSVSPLDAFFHPISWTVGTGLDNRL
ncbi:MAG TPA: DUF4105 domain-containing protein, partial [Candidatus Dormibacteraeota bacterium]|nr:DUF4105 domain-containing protein [Candidatus Dormibacteraeota bacterium]